MKDMWTACKVVETSLGIGEVHGEIKAGLYILWTVGDGGKKQILSAADSWENCVKIACANWVLSDIFENLCGSMRDYEEKQTQKRIDRLGY